MVEEEAAAHLEWLRAMPKVELHVHLDGALDLALLYELAKQHVEELPEEMTSVASGKVIPVRSLVRKCTSAEDFRALVTCKGERSLLEMIDRFMTFLPVLQGRREAIEAFATKFCERQAAEKVLYTEVRYSPHFLAKEGVMTAKEAVEAVMRGLQCGCAKTGITVNQILCCIGSHPEWADECVELAVQNMRLPTCAVVGFDSAGPEDHLAASPSPFVAAFRKAKDAGLGITMHAGELGGPANVRYAVSEAFGAKRIGHGYAVPKDADLMRELRDRGIHIEACPTSSMETGAWPEKASDELDWQTHPAKKMLDAGLAVSWNSDDPEVFGTTLTDELALCMTQMGLSQEDIMNCTVSALDASFAPEEQKSRIREEFLTHYASCGMVPRSTL
eukprot:TRINITY_DN36355_c0_g1_i1.p1 TRINITY_DN36355_c0_g1~~TRINITY_DN36355_c0_g1_i1.p1  ORF type:complete len:389 (-),score=107.04 TRINITY_DN36355_c0_g1_i1:546-1712(-)